MVKRWVAARSPISSLLRLCHLFYSSLFVWIDIARLVHCVGRRSYKLTNLFHYAGAVSKKIWIHVQSFGKGLCLSRNFTRTARSDNKTAGMLSKSGTKLKYILHLNERFTDECCSKAVTPTDPKTWQRHCHESHGKWRSVTIPATNTHMHVHANVKE